MLALVFLMACASASQRACHHGTADQIMHSIQDEIASPVVEAFKRPDGRDTFMRPFRWINDRLHELSVCHYDNSDIATS